MAATTLIRRPQEAATWPELEQYFSTRARQLWHEGWRWSQHLEDVGVGCRTEFTSASGVRFASYYVLVQYHGQGHFKRLVSAEPCPIVTITDCHIEQILDHIGAKYLRAGDLLDSAEYRLVEAVLADTLDEAGAFQMNHVDEGLAVLADLEAGVLTQRAFCLLPLVMSDNALAKYYDSLSQVLVPIPQGLEALALAMSTREQLALLQGDDVSIRAAADSRPVKAVMDLLITESVMQRRALSQLAGDAGANSSLDNLYKQRLEVLGAADRYSWLSTRLPTF